MQIGKSKIGDNYPTFVIAEMSANHGHDLNRAKELVHATIASGLTITEEVVGDTLTIAHARQIIVEDWHGPKSRKE